MGTKQRSTTASLILALILAGAVLWLAGCTSAAEDQADPSSTSANGPVDTVLDDSTDPVDTARQQDRAATTADPLQDTLVGRYADAVATSTRSDAAIAGSPAATYLAYLFEMADITGALTGDVSALTGDGFVLIQGGGLQDVSYDRFEMSELGISDLAMDGRPLSAIVAVLSRPIEHSSGVEILDGFSFTSFGVNRVVVVSVRNGSDATVSSALERSTLVEASGSRQAGVADGVGDEVEIAPGATANVVYTFPRGDADPSAVLNQVFVRLDADGAPQSEITVETPLGRNQPTFFQLEPDGALRGQLDADIGFETDSAEPSTQALDILFKASREILSFDPTSAICVAGYADSVGDEAYNLSLSKARAEAVAEVLAGYGVGNQLLPVGYGEAFAPGDELADPNSRRVDVSFADCPQPR